MLGTGGPPPRGPQPNLSTREIITLTVKSRWVLQQHVLSSVQAKASNGGQPV